MASYLDLKQRIIAEANRDDLEDDLTAVLERHIADACDHYGSMRFWFNQSAVAVPVAANVATLPVPASLRIVDRVVTPYGDLMPISALETATVTPSYSILGDTITLYPTPREATSLTIYGVTQIDAPADDADTNVWTNEAARLIGAHTRMTLFRDVFRDGDVAAAAANAVGEVLSRMRIETERRMHHRRVARVRTYGRAPI